MAGAFETGKYRNVFAEYGYPEAEIQRRVEQTGDIKSPVQRQSRTRRKTERNESFDGKIEVGEPCGLIRIVVENIVRSRGSLHREKKPRAKPPMF